MEAIYYSPMLLGVCLLLAVAISSTALWYVSRPYAGPVFWMAGSWTLIAGIVLFFGFIATGSPVLNVLGNAGQLTGEALFLIGIFHFMGVPCLVDSARQRRGHGRIQHPLLGGERQLGFPHGCVLHDRGFAARAGDLAAVQESWRIPPRVLRSCWWASAC